jgi:hypothetical protein
MVSRVGRFVFVVVPVAAIVVAVVLSSRTNLLLPRCVATLTPLALVVLAGWLSDVWSAREVRPTASRFGAGVFTAVVAMSILGTRHLMATERSNSREIASVLSSNVRPNDLLIIAPEWYAAAFNHYFTGSVEQIDYPYPGKSGMIDFSHVFERVSDPAPLARLRATIDDAGRAGRRVWLVTSRDYVRELRASDVEEATRYRLASAFSIIRVHQISDALNGALGAADTSYFVKGAKPLNDDLLVILYAPHSSARRNPPVIQPQ